MTRHLAAAAALALMITPTSSALSHESRIVPASYGKVRVTVGFNAEPAYEDTVNGLDLFLFTYDGACKQDPTDFYGNPINTRAGDTVKLEAKAIYLKNAAPPTGPYGNTAPPDILKATQIVDALHPLSAVFNDPGHYKSYFRPTHPGGPNTGGAYGFKVYGYVSAKASEYQCEGDAAPTKIPARTAAIHTYWVCSKFGAWPGGTGSFGCIEALRPFPGALEAGYEASKTYPGAGAPKPPVPDTH